ncbi:MAG: PAS domain S-box protein [Deltaproteobacteria bacterium]|nr:PAS domain S-box protein [Deltaproteobacteria bacterium]
MKISATLRSYVRENNAGTLGDLLNGLALEEGYLMDTNNWVSHAFLQTLYHRMISLLNDHNAVYKMSLATPRFQSLGLLDHIVRLVGNPRRIYSQIPKYNKLLKLNGTAIIREIGDTWVLLEDRYDDSAQKTRFDCDYARGVFASIPTLFDLPPADIEEIGCQVSPVKWDQRMRPDHPPLGCGGCLYRVRWSPKKKMIAWKRLFYCKRQYLQAVEDLQLANQTIQSKYDEVKQLAAELKEANQKSTASKRQLEFQQAELAASDSRYRLLAERVADIIWILDLDTLRFDYISPSVEHVRGFTPSEARELTLEQTLSPESLQKMMEIMSEELEKENFPHVDPFRSKTIEYWHSTKEGKYIPAETTVSFIRDDENRPIAIMGVTRDISERKKADAAIAESEKKYRNLFEDGSDVLCIHDLEGILLKTNLFYKKGYGWQKEDLEKLNLRALIPDQHRHKFDEYMKRILSKGADEGYIYIFTKYGRKVALEYRNRLIFGNEGQPLAVHGAARDVTKRLKAEKALKESEEKYRELVKYAPAGICEFDMKALKFISVNDVMCEYTGYSESEFLTLNPYDLLAEESRQTMKTLFNGLYAGRQNPPAVEYKMKTKDGRELWILVNSKFFFEGGVPEKTMSVVHDLTAIRQAQEEKKKLEMQLIKVQKLESLGTLAGGVAHDFNNLLTGIQGNVSLLMLDYKDHHLLYQKLKQIDSYVQRSSDLTRQLLGLARGGKYDVKSTDLNELLKSSAAMFGRTKKEIRIYYSLSAELWPTEVDRGQIEQVLLNLFVNAWQAMPLGGELHLETGNTVLDDRQTSSYSLPEGKYIKMSVTDSGGGMDKETQGKIFDSFFTTKEVGRGTGLGLASSYGIIKNHNGFITVNSRPGFGSTFNIYLPASEKRIENTDPIAREIVTGKGRVLLVDDEEIIIEIGRQILEKLGYETRVAQSGRDALNIYRKHKETIDLVILDMIMPDMNGGDLFDRLKAINPDIKVLLSSGYSVAGQATDILNRGCNGFIQKPFNIPAFSEKISKILAIDGRRP